MVVYDLQETMGWDHLNEFFDKHKFDYAVATNVDFDFKKQTKGRNAGKWQFTIGWGQLNLDMIILRNCNGDDCPNRGFWDDDKTKPIGKGCYYGESLADALKAEGLKY